MSLEEGRRCCSREVFKLGIEDGLLDERFLADLQALMAQ